MLGLGSGLSKSFESAAGIWVSRTDLVLQHNYLLHPVQPLSDGAADINADAANNEYIDVGAIPITTNDVSISAWVYIVDFVNNAAIFSNRHASSPNDGLALRLDSNLKFEMIIDHPTESSAVITGAARNTNQWYHVCGVWDRDGSQYLYVNGVLDTSGDISGKTGDLTHTTNAFIGKNFGSNEIRGYICNVGYWNRVLSQTEIKSIMWKNYSQLSSDETTSLVSWWNLSKDANDNHGSNNGTLS